ncbi:MdtA/MuxA family multidrug efflux RND transporter periplasmic adaptor subunit [bacterium]|nr:MdtA/MuxA family multidrug efflux RND transporter periplasmic adaptor subunit [bacterium]
MEQTPGTYSNIDDQVEHPTDDKTNGKHHSMIVDTTQVTTSMPRVETANPPPSSEPRPRRWPWVIAILVIASVGYFGWSRYQKAAQATAAQKVPPRTIAVQTGVVRQGDMDLYISSLGTVTAFYTVTVKSRVDGELINVAFTEGQMIKQGELLAEIDPRPFQVQLAQAEGQLARDQALLRNAQVVLERDRVLATTNAISQQELQTQEASAKQYEGMILADKAGVDNAKLQLQYCQIAAPISGRIGLRKVDKGNIIHANDPAGIAVITQLQPIAVLFTVPQDDIVRIQKRIKEVGNEGLVVDAFNRDFGTKLATGKLSATENQVDSTTGTLRMKAIFPNADEMLFPNQFVNARLLVDTRHGAMIVPSAAIQRGPKSTFVYVVDKDQTVELRNVTIGPSEGADTIVEDGLVPGETVVTEGVDKLIPGTKVTVRNSAGEGKPSAKDDKPPAQGAR